MEKARIKISTAQIREINHGNPKYRKFHGLNPWKRPWETQELKESMVSNLGIGHGKIKNEKNHGGNHENSPWKNQE